MYLQQDEYEDENGNRFSKKDIRFIGTFVYIADGFFSWSCGNHNCRKDHSSRSHKISGTVRRCEDCGQWSLLLRSDCENINNMVQRVNFYKEELDRHKTKIDSLVASQSTLEKMHEALLKEAQNV
jgi:hypothetical protein